MGDINAASIAKYTDMMPAIHFASAWWLYILGDPGWQFELTSASYMAGFGSLRMVTWRIGAIPYPFDPFEGTS